MTPGSTGGATRAPLTAARVLAGVVDLADRIGIELLLEGIDSASG